LANLKRADKEELDLEWFADHILDAPAHRRYVRAVSKSYRQYRMACRSAQVTVAKRRSEAHGSEAAEKITKAQCDRILGRAESAYVRTACIANSKYLAACVRALWEAIKSQKGKSGEGK
jgi:ribose 1,5-bisphosphokinase PhnN